MWPFPKPEPRVGNLTNGAYRRWLRAGCPQPLVEFLLYGEDEQETLAALGDAHEERRAETYAGAIAEVIQGVADGLSEGARAAPAADEAAFAEQLAAAGATGRPHLAPAAPPAGFPTGLGGVGARREARKSDVEKPASSAIFPGDTNEVAV